ncbi:unnamed protein product [Dicrocoelium dendriticum]|nr:unnamed protein product [Dicrocoelium dendriticum]
MLALQNHPSSSAIMQFDAVSTESLGFSSATSPLPESFSVSTSLCSLVDDQANSDTKDYAEVIRKAQEVVGCLSDRCEELSRLNDSFDVLRKEIRSQIDQCVQMIQRALNERHEHLLNELDSFLSARNEIITKMHTDFEARLQRLSSHVDLLKRLMYMSPNSTPSVTKNTSNLPSRNIAVEKHKQEIEKLLQLPVPFHPSESDTMSFFPTELDQLLSLIRCVGAVGLTSIDVNRTTLSRNCEEEFTPLRRCALNEEVRSDILPLDSLGRCVTNPTSRDFTASLTPRQECVTYAKVSEINNTTRVNNHGSFPTSNEHSVKCAQLQVVYKVSTPGLYDLNIKLYGEHILGSPFLVYARAACKPNVQKWINDMRDISQSPCRMRAVLVSRRRCKSSPAVSIEHVPLEALADLNALEKGDYLCAIGTKGRGDGEFANPTGVCVTREHKYLVTDSSNASVQVFNSKAEFLFRFAEYGYHPGQLMRPMDVAETINGNYLISDFELHCVTVYSPTGAYISRFGQRYLAGPKGIIADSRGRIIVVDQKSCMICIFKPTGKFINRFGTRGSGDNQFSNPGYVAVNSADEIYVSDYLQHAIKVFDPNGLYLYRFGVHGMEPGCLHSPTGVAFDKQDNLYVSDWGNNRVQVFDSTGRYLLILNSQLEPLNGPYGLTYDYISQRILVTDPGNYCVKIYDPQRVVGLRQGPSEVACTGDNGQMSKSASASSS